ncbi:hypothetical protein CLV59_103619 [Chitinophaga dinghuensis]|uniref:Colicin import membrane protein n=1 Tax=Chitinophaga dinghuensis TaxID=1539050 RepID=A0A327WBY8_9BACT|nr:hypothetical protein [Chitinophaga dinghuensis]RAJ83648.1 hypothetical protein CLV59_103619 [Chitinophaga dinghuensis]
MKRGLKAVTVVAIILFTAMGAVAQKIDKDAIATLKRKKEILNEQTKLNDLELKAAYEALSQQELIADAEKLNEEADKAMKTAKQHASDLHDGEIGDEKLAKKATQAAKDASKSTEKAHKQAEKIAKSKKYLERLNDDIRKQRILVDELIKENA